MTRKMKLAEVTVKACNGCEFSENRPHVHLPTYDVKTWHEAPGHTSAQPKFRAATVRVPAWYTATRIDEDEIEDAVIRRHCEGAACTPEVGRLSPRVIQAAYPSWVAMARVENQAKEVDV